MLTGNSGSFSSLLNSSFFGEIPSVWLTFLSCTIHSGLADSLIHWEKFSAYDTDLLVVSRRKKSSVLAWEARDDFLWFLSTRVHPDF